MNSHPLKNTHTDHHKGCSLADFITLNNVHIAAPLLLLHDHIGCSMLCATAYGAILLAQRAYPHIAEISMAVSGSPKRR